MNKAVFLDRDGVINVEVDYLHEPDKVRLEEHVVPALRLMRQKGYLLIVVTNQAGVAKGIYPESDIAPVHEKISQLLAGDGIAIDGFYYCPHHPGFTGACDCRKPAPGMLLRAAREHDVDLSRSFMAGDRMSDVNAGINAGCKKSFLLLTGYGKKAAAEAPEGTPVAENLLEVAQMIG